MFARQVNGMSSLSIRREDDEKKKILPKELNIVWGKDPRYWRLNQNANQSAESSTAELLQVSWLEVTAKFQGLPANKKYAVGFTISLNQDMFGWDNSPVYLMAKVGKKGNHKWKKIIIDSSKRGSSQFDIPESDELIVETISGTPEESAVHLGLYEVWSGKWKGGLKIHCAFAKEIK